MQDHYDILICGGGLAGLTLALQLKREIPGLRMVVIEKTRRPLPPGGFKVGESTVEGAAHYLAETLGLADILDRDHLRKNGPRFFTGGGGIPLADRPEIGSAGFPRMPSWQIDRGKLEAELRARVENYGIELLEGTILRDMLPVEEPDQASLPALHEVRLQDAAGGRRFSVKGRWLIDALGRRRKLQRLLGTTRENLHRASAAWLHFDSELNINEFLPPGPWHKRDPQKIRFRSTNFFAGDGYWTWLLILKGGFTSVGIVTDETLHPFKQYGSYAKALQWLHTHEPLLAEKLTGMKAGAFRGLRDFSYSSTRVFSHTRWSCVGDAGVFLDPLYSPGIDFIGLSNCMTTSMIKKDLRGELTAAVVDDYNRLYLALSNGLLESFRGNYRAFGKTVVFKAKLYWDTLFYWSFFAPILIFRLCDEPRALLDSQAFHEYLRLEQTMQNLFRTWVPGAPDTQPPGYTPYPPRNSLLVDLHLRLLERNSRPEALLRMQEHLELCREAARQITEQAAGAPGVDFQSTTPMETADPPRPHELAMRLELAYYRGETDENAHRASRMLLEQMTRSAFTE